MNTTLLLMAQFDGRSQLSIGDVCEAIGYGKQTAYNEISAGTFPIPMQKRAGKWIADIRDVAEYLDRERAAAKAKHEDLKEKMSHA